MPGNFRGHETAGLDDHSGAGRAGRAALRTLCTEPASVPDLICRPVLETTAQDLAGAIEFSAFGPFAAVRLVLPEMRALGRGSILFVNGGSGARPNPKVAGTSIAFAGEGAYARMLHDTLGPEGIQVGQLIIPGAIRPGRPTHDPAVLAGLVWHLHTHPDEFRVFAEAMPVDA